MGQENKYVSLLSQTTQGQEQWGFRMQDGLTVGPRWVFSGQKIFAGLSIHNLSKCVVLLSEKTFL